MEKKEMEEQIAKNADVEAQKRQQMLNKEAKTMDDYWRCLHPIDALKDDYGKLDRKMKRYLYAKSVKNARVIVYVKIVNNFCDLCWPKVHSRVH